MRLLQINTVAHGTSPVATIMRRIHCAAKDYGIDAHMACGYGDGDGCGLVMTGKAGRIRGALAARLSGKDGFGQKAPTLRLTDYIRHLKPDIVHLHNAHGYYLCLPDLLAALRDMKIPPIVTLHDDWWLTGRCAIPATYNCNRYATAECDNCPHRDVYPAVWRSVKAHYKPTEGITFATPSHRLAKAFNARLIPNGVSISKAPDALAKKDYALAIANIWTKGKSLQSLVEIAPRLKFPIVVVGDLKGASLAHNMIHAGKDLSDTELARLYTEASILINPSLSESYGMTVAEAINCGTPVVIRKGTDSQDIIGPGDGIAIDFADTDATVNAVYEAAKMTPQGSRITSVKDMTDAYINLYKEVLNNV